MLLYLTCDLHVLGEGYGEERTLIISAQQLSE